MTDIRISSCCKINLFLHVTGKRADNYHTLQTLFLPVKGLTDFITCSFDADNGIEVNSLQPDIPSGRDNLIFRAAEQFALVSKVAPSWKFTLEKHVPVAAGLGGGSSNAASVLKVLNDFYRKLDEKQLEELAVSIGADVPFFLKSLPAWAGGIGEKLEYLSGNRAPLYIVLVNPGFPVGVKWSYSQLDPAGFSPADISTKTRLTDALYKGDVQTISTLARNDLGKALFCKFPQLALLRRCMLDTGASCVQVSGSGPTLFAVCGSADVQHRVAEKVRSEFASSSGIRVFECEV